MKIKRMQTPPYIRFIREGANPKVEPDTLDDGPDYSRMGLVIFLTLLVTASVAGSVTMIVMLFV